jgi:hypothetical protein
MLMLTIKRLADYVGVLEQRRRRVAELTAGERLFLPAGIAQYLDDLRALGISSWQVTLERDGWIMLAASYPDKALEWIAQKRADLADPEYRRFYLSYDQAHDWDPGDPRLAELAGELVERLVRNAAAAGVASADWTELGALSADEQAMLSALSTTTPRPGSGSTNSSPSACRPWRPARPGEDPA